MSPGRNVKHGDMHLIEMVNMLYIDPNKSIFEH